ncbi:MAG: LysR family transcriptional regulator [Rubrivivax sp.]|nr:LysR family transcriptional regulator [Rubrivivax sp.]
MELRHLRHFLALAELGSFRLASERVHLTPQAVSKSIAQLEDRIGARLFERDGRGVHLTPIGELLLPHARAITAELRHFDDEHDAFRGARSGRLAIGCTPTLLGDVVPDVLQQLHVSQPQLVLAVVSGNWETLLERLLGGSIDLVISTEPVGVIDEDVVIEKLCDDANVVIAAPGHPLAAARPTPAELQQAEWIGIDRLPRAETDLHRYFKAMGLKPPIPRMRTEVNTFALAWVERTQALCALPSRAVAGAVRAGRVTTLDVRLTDPPWSLVAAWRRRAVRTRGMAAFLESLRSALHGTDALQAAATTSG